MNRCASTLAGATPKPVRCRKGPHAHGCHVWWRHPKDDLAKLLYWTPGGVLVSRTTALEMEAKERGEAGTTAGGAHVPVAASRGPDSSAPAAPPANGHAVPNLLDDRAVAVAKGFTGDTCGQCGQPSMVRDGKCLKCMSCGSASGGCS